MADLIYHASGQHLAATDQFCVNAFSFDKPLLKALRRQDGTSKLIPQFDHNRMATCCIWLSQ
ncbi:hypothetical protein DAI22_03g297565 [Oryza sativa Japonica Group]|nr:hypothetical protein DAI22_03g297565 [Oryza sativa Japonica Group]